MNSIDFWAGIEHQLTELRSARSAADVLRILAIENHTTPAFFAGSGGDGTVMEALESAGWSIIWAEAHYHYAMRAPDGTSITYIEGDIREGDDGRL